MTAFPVPDASNRACPSSLAGTTCRRDRSRISASALQSTIGCRTDRSGPFRRCVTPLRPPPLSATIPTYGHPATESGLRTPKPSQFAANLSPGLFPGFPIKAKRAFPLLTVSAPNSSQNGNSLQNRRDRGAGRRPRRPRPSRLARRSPRGDVSPFSAFPRTRRSLGQRLKVGCPVVYSKT